MKARRLPILNKNDIQRFKEKVKIKGNCEEWVGGKDTTGYGVFSKGNKNYQAHRIAYYIEMKIDPYPKLVVHKCKNRLCVNIDHLELKERIRNTIFIIEGKNLGIGRNCDLIYNSVYRGVRWRIDLKMYESYIIKRKQYYILGWYFHEKDAAKRYNEIVKKLFNRKVKLNNV
jgi:hypothetical protein